MSKRRYVRNRLMGLSAVELAEMARAIANEYDDPGLAALVGAGWRCVGVEGELKNLIFAAHGPKPRIVLRDAINNVIEIVEHADKLPGLRPPARPRAGCPGARSPRGGPTPRRTPGAPSPRAACTGGCCASLGSPAEEVLFRAYGTPVRPRPAPSPLPALVPQVYLHYDPYTLRELAGRDGEALKRQRMDFLMLLRRPQPRRDRGRRQAALRRRRRAPAPPATPRWSPRTARCAWPATRSTASAAPSSTPEDPQAPARAQRGSSTTCSPATGPDAPLV